MKKVKKKSIDCIIKNTNKVLNFAGNKVKCVNFIQK